MPPVEPHRRRRCTQGLISSLSASNIMLALEPECAMLAALADCAPQVRARLRPGAMGGKRRRWRTARHGFLSCLPGTRVMIVDAGGGTVDITVDEVVSVGPVRGAAPAAAPAPAGPCPKRPGRPLLLALQPPVPLGADPAASAAASSQVRAVPCVPWGVTLLHHPAPSPSPPHWLTRAGGRHGRHHSARGLPALWRRMGRHLRRRG